MPSQKVPLDREPFLTRCLRRFDDRGIFLYSESTDDALEYWRERLTFAVLASGTALSFLALGPSLYVAVAKHLWILLAADSAAFLLLVTLLLCRLISLRTKAVVLLLMTFTMGVIVIFQLGFMSGGPAWLFAFPVLAGLLLGLRAALAAVLLNGAAIVLMGWLAYPGLAVERELLNSLSRSIAAWSNFIFLNAVVAVSAAVLVDGLQALNRKTAAATAALRKEKAALLETGESLTREIAERKTIAAELERARDSAEVANRAKSEFLANMSHELRTPLNHIIGFTQLVVDRNFGELTPPQEESLNDVLQSSHHLLGLIDEILDMSKVESGRMTLSLSTVFLRPLLENSLIMVKKQAAKRRIELIPEIPDRPESLQADERKLKRMLHNLLLNAVKFTPEGGTIRLRVAPDNESLPGREALRFSIVDSGIGLQKEDMERIFQPFEQVDNSISRPYQGTGMGLALTRRLVELHRGKIWAESEGVGKGSTFHLVVPLSEEQPAPPPLPVERSGAPPGPGPQTSS